MSDRRRERIKQLFQAAMERDPPDRSAFLEIECRDDLSLKEEVESLLLAGEADSFLEAAPDLSTAAVDSEPTPRVIDRYRIVECLGAGGMGEVWLAEQQEPVRRRVALKVIKAGMDTAQVVARFETERQALALMEHPAIARVLDAGATPAGRPYFVMEHVPGLPITEHCDRARLGIDARLELLIQVCEGVQHAHQKAVLHRDLKPSNVLVAEHDGRATPKIIDFGLAKAMAQPLTGHSRHTGLGMLIGTPGYMSPEQADPIGLDVDTRTDVYALGIMLYELLVGALPFDPVGLRQVGGEGMAQRIRESQPRTPSRRLAAVPAAEHHSAAANRGYTDALALRRRLRGDLDWITMKAIAPERELRYGSPAELADDLRRHLRDEPIRAGSPGRAYRARKFIRRHRVGVTVAAAVSLALAAGLVGTTLGLVRARRAERMAHAQAERSERVSGFLADLLRSVDPARMGETEVADLRQRVEQAWRVEGGNKAAVAAAREAFDDALRRVNRMDAARSLMDREILAPATRSIAESMSDEPLLAARLRATIGETYGRLGLYPTAEALQRQALATRTSRLGPEHPDTLDSSVALATMLIAQGRMAEAESRLREAVAIRRRLLGDDDPATLHTLRVLADSILEPLRYRETSEPTRRGEEAEALYRETLARQRRVLGAEHGESLLTLNNLANACFLRGGYGEAASLYREALETRRRVVGGDDGRSAAYRGNLAATLHLQSLYPEAETHYKESILGLTRAYGEDHLQTLHMSHSLATMYLDMGRLDDAERLFRATVERERRVLGEEHPETRAATSALIRTLTRSLALMPRTPSARRVATERDLAGFEASLRRRD